MKKEQLLPEQRLLAAAVAGDKESRRVPGDDVAFAEPLPEELELLEAEAAELAEAPERAGFVPDEGFFGGEAAGGGEPFPSGDLEDEAAAELDAVEAELAEALAGGGPEAGSDLGDDFETGFENDPEGDLEAAFGEGPDDFDLAGLGGPAGGPESDEETGELEEIEDFEEFHEVDDLSDVSDFGDAGEAGPEGSLGALDALDADGEGGEPPPLPVGLEPEAELDEPGDGGTRGTGTGDGGDRCRGELEQALFHLARYLRCRSGGGGGA